MKTSMEDYIPEGKSKSGVPFNSFKLNVFLDSFKPKRGPLRNVNADTIIVDFYFAKIHGYVISRKNNDIKKVKILDSITDKSEGMQAVEDVRTVSTKREVY